eukprot:TRINITY_DN10681_c0_g1_i1.p1 TRINITY_DN10681_c0_g1~~TRINITY_DN10681_c0_g1_i1.p1  ORF type:complete len:212 (-),score=27.32 TRINITY_DN10681_c0_g1_i1:175-810(-)
MKAANDLSLNPDFLIVGEPTGGKVIRLQKGILHCLLEVSGVSSHSGYPHLGRSAISDMVSLLGKVESYPWPSDEILGATTVNVGFVQGGQAANALAEKCTARLMFRLICCPEVVVEILQGLCSQYKDVKMTVLGQNDPVNMTYVSELVTGFEFGVASFNTDIPYLHFDGRAILYGHGDITDAHCPREFINIEDLRALPHAYERLVVQLLER